MDMGSLRAELQLPHHFITGEDDHDLDEDIMMLGSTPQVTSPLDPSLAVGLTPPPPLVVGPAVSNAYYSDALTRARCSSSPLTTPCTIMRSISLMCQIKRHDHWKCKQKLLQGLVVGAMLQLVCRSDNAADMVMPAQCICASLAGCLQ